MKMKSGFSMKGQAAVLDKKKRKRLACGIIHLQRKIKSCNFQNPTRLDVGEIWLTIS
jgi:hypothetical protein